MIDQKIERFLRQALFASEAPHSVQLRQIHAGAGDSPLMTWHVETDLSLYDDNRMTEWTHEILDLAQQNADGFSGVTSYYLLPQYLNKSVGARGPVFRLRGNDLMSPEDANMMGLDSEPANSKGITAQLMRHNEALARITTQSMQGMLAIQQSIIDRQQSHIERMERTHLETFTALEEAESQKHERQLARTKLENEEKRKAQLIEKASKYVPALLAKFKPLADSPTGLDGAEDHPLINGLFETFDNLSSEQVEKIAAVLGADAIPLMEVYEIYVKEKEKRAKQRANGESESFSH